MKSIFVLYRNAFGGLSQAAWMLALVMFINRAGTMVLPFLSIYLTAHLGFDVKQAGIVLSLFGLGAIVGTFLGGYLSDKFGHFWVQSLSLVFTAVLFVIVAQLESFYWLSGGIFVLAVIAESLRPANSASVAFYAKPENITRAFSLNRMALNLGFSMGPALGGALAAISYKFLFLADAFTCFSAGLLFFFYFRHRKGNQFAETSQEKEPSGRSPYRDRAFIWFVVCCAWYAIVFFQLFTTLPLYYRQVYQLSEEHIGLLLGMNGMVVFLFEMILVYRLGDKVSLRWIIVLGTLLSGLSFVMLNVFVGVWVLYAAMIVISFSEILAMPFMATLSVQRSGVGNRGGYMALYSMAYASAHVLSPFLGTRIIANYTFETLWWAAALASVITAIGFAYFVPKVMGKG